VNPRTTGDTSEDLRASLDEHIAAARNLYGAGVRLLIGTDASRNNIAVHGITMHRELELLNRAMQLKKPEGA
jgi:hypothetical protein